MTQGPFRHYGAAISHIRSERDRARRQLLACEELASGIGIHTTAAADASAGVLGEALGRCPVPVQLRLRGLAGAAERLYRVLDGFGDAVEEYDGWIDRLNERFEIERRALCSSFDDASAAVGDELASYTSAVGELYQRLEEERQRHEAVLDDAAEWASTVLSEHTSDEAWSKVSFPTLPTGSALMTSAATGASAVLSTRTLVSAWKTSHGIVRKGRLNLVAHYLRSVDPLRRGTAAGLPGTTPWEWRQDVLRALVQRQNIVDAAMPSALFGRYGANIKVFGTVSDIAGKSLAPLGIASGGITIFDTWRRRGELGTADEAVGYVYGGASMVSGGLGTAALLMGSAAFPPAGAAIAIGAGAVALGALAYQHRDDIAELASDLGEAVVDRAPGFLDDPARSALDAAEDALHYTGDGLGQFFAP